MTGYTAWVVGLLNLPFFALLALSTQVGNDYKWLLALLSYSTLIIQAVCLFLYRVSINIFGNSIFNEDIDLTRPKKMLREFLFSIGYVLCYITTIFTIMFLFQILIPRCLGCELPFSVGISVSTIGTFFIFGFLPKITIGYYRRLFGKMLS